MQKLIPDTNFLIYLAKYKLLDYLEEYDLYILKQVIDELKALSSDKKLNSEDKKQCSIVLGFLETIRGEIEVIDDVEGKTDDAIVKFAGKEKALVGTMDKFLIKRLKEKNISIIYVRQKKFLERR
jgi:rRNA-processing protein FCF1